MGSYYVLSDDTEREDLITCPGRVAEAILDFVDTTDTDVPPISILEWEFHGYDAHIPKPVYIDATTIEADMMALIKLFFSLPPEHKFGGTTDLDWIDWFEIVVLHARAHPESRYRSAYFV